MKKIVLVFLFVLMAFPALAGSQNGIVKLSLWDQLALAVPNNKEDVTGLDFGIGSKTTAVTGLQWDLVWAETTYELKGVSCAWIVSMANKMQGFQTAAFVKANDIIGAQFGVVSLANSVNGVQVGFFNQTDYLHGLQLGFVNYARDVDRGLQVGLLNVAENGYVPVMIFVNGRF